MNLDFCLMFFFLDINVFSFPVSIYLLLCFDLLLAVLENCSLLHILIIHHYSRINRSLPQLILLK